MSDVVRRGPGVGGSDLTILVTLRQIRRPYHAIGADVRPRLSDPRTPTARDARCRSPPDAKFRPVRYQPGGGTPCKTSVTPLASVDKWRQGCLHAAQLPVASTSFIMSGFEAAPPRSRSMLASHFSMFHVLTDMCSRIVHRLSSFLFISSNERNQTLLNAAIHRTQAVAAARDGGRSALAIELATRAYTLVHRGAHM